VTVNGRISCRRKSNVAKLTISLPNDLYRVLRERAAQRGKTLEEIVVESLEASSSRPTTTAAVLVAAAREHSGLRAEEASLLAVEETRAQRAK
jgi:plasmid stability protein